MGKIENSYSTLRPLRGDAGLLPVIRFLIRGDTELLHETKGVNQMSNTKNKPDLHAYVVTGTAEKPFYTKIGAAWTNKAGGYGLRLDALPVNGEIVLFPPKEAEPDQQSE